MVVRIAQDVDYQAVRDLYDLVFHDDEDFTEQLFSQVYNVENTIVVEIDGRVVASSQIIDFQTVGYVYAVMTHPDYRHRGCMRMMMNFLESEAKRRGYEYIFLRPQEEYLFNVYAKYGFKRKIFEKDTFINKSLDLFSLSDDEGRTFEGMVLRTEP